MTQRERLAYFYDGNRMMGWNEQDGPFWHGTGRSVEERLYEAIEGMAELHARLKAREETDTHDAARAQALGEAARFIESIVEIARDGERRGDPAMALHAAAIRALSPLPPGSRVVVIPPEGSEEWEHAMERGMDYSRRAVSRGITGEQHLEVRLTYALAAALRALTGGDDRG